RAQVVGGDDLEPRADQGVEDVRQRADIRQRAGRANGHIACLGLVDGLDGARVPGEAGSLLLADVADPIEFTRVVARRVRALLQQWLDDVRGPDRADRRAVAQGLVGEDVHCRNAARAGNELNVDGWVTGKIGGNESREGASIDVIAAAGVTCYDDSQ